MTVDPALDRAKDTATRPSCTFGMLNPIGSRLGEL